MAFNELNSVEHYIIHRLPGVKSVRLIGAVLCLFKAGRLSDWLGILEYVRIAPQITLIITENKIRLNLWQNKK